jgi:type IV secretory pathway TraG/TraD family ATPase VirD4
VQRIAPLIRMFVTLFSRRFTAGETQATNRKFKIPLLFVLDEFDKLGKMEELHMNMGIHNGYGIHYMLIFQSLNQLNTLYGQNHSFLAHCRTSIFYQPGAGELQSAELISKICGVESISRANVSYSGGRGNVAYSNRSLSQQDQQRNLINADEVIKLPMDSALLVCQGIPPAIIKKNVYYEDPVFKCRYQADGKELKAAFTTREEAVSSARETIDKLNGPHWFDLPGGTKPTAAPEPEGEPEGEPDVEDDPELEADLERFLAEKENAPVEEDAGESLDTGGTKNWLEKDGMSGEGEAA